MARNRKNRQKPGEDGPAEWIVTYSDMVTLLLTFFIMLFSMASIDAKKFDEVSQALRNTFLFKSDGDVNNVNKGKDFFKITDYHNPENTDEQQVDNEIIDNEKAYEEVRAQKLEEFKEKVQSAILELNLGEHIEVIEGEEEIVLRLKSIALFDLGDAELEQKGKDILKEISDFFKQLDNEIIVQGHTDNLPIVNNNQYPTNWELSTRRATNVVRFLSEECGIDPSKITAQGNSKYKPIADNNTSEGRQKNRRIDIVIQK